MAAGEKNIVVDSLQKSQQALTEIRAHEKHCDERNIHIHQEIRDRDGARVRDVAELRQDLNGIAEGIRSDLGELKSRNIKFLVYLIGVLLAVIGAMIVAGGLNNFKGEQHENNGGNPTKPVFQAQ